MTASRLVRSIPRSMRVTRIRLTTKSHDTTSSTTTVAISAVRNVLRQRRRPVAVGASLSLSSVDTGARDVCHAGTSEHSTPVTTAQAIAAASTRPFREIVEARNIPGSAVVTATFARRTPAIEHSSAPVVAPSDSKRPSASTASAICRREAPSDARIAISWVRAADRVSIRLAAFAHATRTTRAAAPRASSIQWRTGAT